VTTAVVAGVVLATPVTARAAIEPPIAVEIHQYQFHPDPLSVEVGQAVAWTNEDSAAHDVTSSSGPEGFASGSLATGQQFTFTFEHAGSYTYLCTVHPDMVGSITVTPAPTTTLPLEAPARSIPVAATTAPHTAVAAPGFVQAARPLLLLLALAAAVVAGCLLLLGVGRGPEPSDG
jgi:plastocyanin